jgi:hypothetical protein
MNAKKYAMFFDDHYPMAVGGARYTNKAPKEQKDAERAAAASKYYQENKEELKRKARERYAEKVGRPVGRIKATPEELKARKVARYKRDYKRTKSDRYMSRATRQALRERAIRKCETDAKESKYICKNLVLKKATEKNKEINRIIRQLNKLIGQIHAEVPAQLVKTEEIIAIIKDQHPETVALLKKPSRLATIVNRINNIYNAKKMEQGIGEDDDIDVIRPAGDGFGGSIATKLFQKVSNGLRKRLCHGRARDLYEGELHAPCHNYTGPGTRMDIPLVYNYQPYNEIDNCSRLHDIDYDGIFRMPAGKEKEQAIREADEKALICYDKFKNTQGYNWAYTGIKNKTRLENILPSITRKLAGEYFGSK